MILKQLRLSRNLSQEQLAQMSGLNVRTIQRIEGGQNPSIESLKCLASVFEVEISTLTQEKFMIDKKSNDWQNTPFIAKWYFRLGYFSIRPSRRASNRVEIASHITGVLFCAIGLWSERALQGGLLMLLSASIFRIHNWLGDKYGVWYDDDEPANY